MPRARTVLGPLVLLAPALGALGACHRWRPLPEPVPPPAAAEGATLRVTTRALSTGEAHRYVLRSARVEGDSLVGVVVEVSRSVAAGEWSGAQQAVGRPLVSLATADIVHVSRLEHSPQRTVTLVVVVLALAVAAAYGILAYGLSQPGY